MPINPNAFPSGLPSDLGTLQVAPATPRTPPMPHPSRPTDQHLAIMLRQYADLAEWCARPSGGTPGTGDPSAIRQVADRLAAGRTEPTESFEEKVLLGKAALVADRNCQDDQDAEDMAAHDAFLVLRAAGLDAPEDR